MAASDVSQIFTEWCLETEPEWQALSEQREARQAETPLYSGLDMGDNLRVVHAYPDNLAGACSLSIAPVASTPDLNASAERIIPQMERYADELREAPGWTVVCDRRGPGAPVRILFVENDDAVQPRVVYLWAVALNPPGAPTVIAATYRVTADDTRLAGC
ncbi:hypothetical protein [Jannaschia sp. CCS1]|uniref:hypothetical protein n=1 Tax=Jannaschia sp. (strain CCS1) TaxID=290400 RepID=UPI0003076ED8|nr:hypothetical protein [Jannaschia sp. CCS1]